MKFDLLKIIKILAVDYSEIFIDIETDSFNINSIEIDGDNIILHSFIEDLDIEVLFEDIAENDQDFVYQTLSSLLYN